MRYHVHGTATYMVGPDQKSFDFSITLEAINEKHAGSLVDLFLKFANPTCTGYQRQEVELAE